MQKDSTTNVPATRYNSWVVSNGLLLLRATSMLSYSINCCMDLHTHMKYRGGLGALFLNGVTPGGD